MLTNGNGNQSPSVNGTRTTSTSLFFNGIDATNITTNEGSLNDNIAPAPETLQEVKLQTSLYDASTGRSGGGNFQLVTKTGGNSFNGTCLLLPAKRKVQRQRFLLQQGRHRPAKSATQRSRLHGWWSNRQRKVLLLRQLSIHERDHGFCADRAKHLGDAAGVHTARRRPLTAGDRNAFNLARDQFRASQQAASCTGVRRYTVAAGMSDGG